MTFSCYSGRLAAFEYATRTGHKITIKQRRSEPYDMNANLFRVTHTPIDREAQTWWEQSFGCAYEDDPQR